MESTTQNTMASKAIGALDGVGWQVLRNLQGAAYTVIDPFTATIDDKKWNSILGDRISLHGGCELLVDEGRLCSACDTIDRCDTDQGNILIPVIVNDPCFPSLGVVISILELITKCNRIKASGDGPMHKIGVVECGHGMSTPGCRTCFYKWWNRQTG